MLQAARGLRFVRVHAHQQQLAKWASPKSVVVGSGPLECVLVEFDQLAFGQAPRHGGLALLEFVVLRIALPLAEPVAEEESVKFGPEQRFGRELMCVLVGVRVMDVA